MQHDVIIIGGGLAGLRVYEMLSERGKTNIILLESREQCGGRIRTVYDDNEKMNYESGPWRIPSNHERVVTLFAKHGISLAGLKSPTPAYESLPPPVHGLTSWDVNVLKGQNPIYADICDQKTGYAGETHAASSTSPYATNTNHFMVAPKGLSELTKKMEQDSNVVYKTQVVDVFQQKGKCRVQCIIRDENEFRDHDFMCESVFICVPPHVAQRWPVFSSACRSHLTRVEACPLHHIYVQKFLNTSPFHTINAKSALVQTISDGSHFFQASYSAGRVARFWNRLRLSFPNIFESFLASQLKKHFSIVFQKEKVYSHFWPCAYHSWKAVPEFELSDSVKLSVTPNACKLPNIFWAGEAFSSYQAWMEGALETAELAVNAYFSGTPYLGYRNKKMDEMALDGRILCKKSVNRWKDVHPGGIAAIENHKNENIDDLFLHVGHSDDAWAMIASMQVAWMFPDA